MSIEASTLHGEQPTAELLTGVIGDHCANCHAPMASDQRYCLNCGERRGKARYSFDALEGAAAAEPPQLPPEHRPRTPSGATLVAGVATLLLAMGVGVLIGTNSNSGAKTGAPQIVTINGGAAAPANTAATGAGAGSATRTAKKGKTKVVKVHVSAKTAAAANQAAAKVLGNSGNLSKNVTQKQGAACSGGAGCQNGKFTGNFFPGG